MMPGRIPRKFFLTWLFVMIGSTIIGGALGFILLEIIRSLS
jgi:hypothetical protein